MSYPDARRYDFVFVTRNKGDILIKYYEYEYKGKRRKLKPVGSDKIRVDLSTTPKRQTVIKRQVTVKDPSNWCVSEREYVEEREVSVIVYDPKYLAKTLNYYMRHYGLDQDYIFRAKELEEKQKNIF